jgi:hypothetical protein
MHCLPDCLLFCAGRTSLLPFAPNAVPLCQPQHPQTTWLLFHHCLFEKVSLVVISAAITVSLPLPLRDRRFGSHVRDRRFGGAGGGGRGGARRAHQHPLLLTGIIIYLELQYCFYHILSKMMNHTRWRFSQLYLVKTRGGDHIRANVKFRGVQLLRFNILTPVDNLSKQLNRP